MFKGNLSQHCLDSGYRGGCIKLNDEWVGAAAARVTTDEYAFIVQGGGAGAHFSGAAAR